MDKLIEATHSDINMGSFFKKLIVRVASDVDQWEATENVSSKLADTERKFDLHLKKLIGISPQLMMPGNYARVLFDPANEEIILGLIDDNEKYDALVSILDKFRFMRSVYRAIKPDPNHVAMYKTITVAMGELIKTHFSFARWPNYLHKLIEHVQEILQDPNGPGSIGAFSGEGNEAGNKIFRLFRKNFANKGNSYKGLEDVLKLHWLYSSPALSKLAEVQHRKNKCAVCGDFGHNKRSCRRKT